MNSGKTEQVLVQREERVLHLTLNRPEKRNALTSEMCSIIVKSILAAQTDRRVGSILINSTGQVFCSGMDVHEALVVSDHNLASIHEKLFTIGAQSLKPIVVCVDGPALGGGLGLVAQGHVVIVEPGAVFGLPEIHLGLWPFLVYRAIEEALGPRRTIELSLTGHTFSAHDAYDWGLVHQICVPPVDEQERAAAVARDLAKASPKAIRAGLHYVRASRGKSWKKAGKFATALRHKLMATEDFREGVAAFREKRDPQWPSLARVEGAERSNK